MILVFTGDTNFAAKIEMAVMNFVSYDNFKILPFFQISILEQFKISDGDIMIFDMRNVNSNFRSETFQIEKKICRIYADKTLPLFCETSRDEYFVRCDDFEFIGEIVGRKVKESRLLCSKKRSCDILYFVENKLYYLGYELKLTDTEMKILKFLYSNKKAYLDVETIFENCLENTSSDATKIVVHISNINKKAFKIGGRKLIENKTNKGYRLNLFA